MLSGKYWFVIPFARAYQAKHLRDYPYFMSLQCLCMVTFGPTPSLVVTFWPLFGSPLPWKKIDMIYGPPLYSKGTKISLFAPFWAFIWKGILWWPIDVEIFFCCPHSVFDKNTKPLFFIRTLWIRGTTTTSKFTDWRAKKKTSAAVVSGPIISKKNSFESQIENAGPCTLYFWSIWLGFNKVARICV